MENIWERSIKNGADQACPSTFDVFWKSNLAGPTITGVATFLILYWQRPLWVQLDDGGDIYEPNLNYYLVFFISFLLSIVAFIIPNFYPI